MRTGGLLERDSELAVLAGALRRARSRNGALVAVVGPPGIGKTALLARVQQMGAEAGMCVLTAAGHEFEGDFPFSVARQLYRGLLTELDRGRRDTLLAGSAALAEPVVSAALADPSDSSQAASFAVLHGLYWLTLNLAAEAPLLAVVDDVHWADVPSLRFLAYIAQRLEGMPMALVIATRSEGAREAAGLISAVIDHPEAGRLEPSPLSVGAVCDLVISALGQPEPAQEFVEACHRATGGCRSWFTNCSVRWRRTARHRRPWRRRP